MRRTYNLEFTPAHIILYSSCEEEQSNMCKLSRKTTPNPRYGLCFFFLILLLSVTCESQTSWVPTAQRGVCWYWQWGAIVLYLIWMQQAGSAFRLSSRMSHCSSYSVSPEFASIPAEDKATSGRLLRSRCEEGATFAAGAVSPKMGRHCCSPGSEQSRWVVRSGVSSLGS